MLETIEQEVGTQSWMDSWSEEMNSSFEDVSFYLTWLNRARRGMWAFSFLPPIPPSCGCSLTLYSSFWTILVLHLLVTHAYTWIHVPLTTPSNVLLVVVAQIALSRGHVHINGTVCYLWVFNAEVTAFLGIAPSPCSHD